MAAVNDLGTMNGLAKTVYSDKLIDLIPDFALLQKRIAFVSDEKQQGAYYAQPVVLASECGFTYGGTHASDAGTATALNAAVAGVTKEAQVYGSELILRSQLRFSALARAAQKGVKAFKKASSWKVEDMNNATRKRLEIAMLHGQVGLGIVESISAGTTSYTCVITAASWAGGIWAGSEGATIDIVDTTLATRRNTAVVTVASVNSDTRTLTLTATTDELDTVAATDVLFFRGACTVGGTPAFSEMAGLAKIIANTGTLFGISASTYSLWKGNSVASVGQISHAKIQDAVGRAVNKGLMEKVLCLVSPKAWSVLNADASALRVFDSSYSGSKSENGSEGLVFHSVNGAIEVLAHPFVKDGEAFVVPEAQLMRLGSTDLTFGVPGMDQDFFRILDGYDAVELLCMADQAIFLEKPAHATQMTGITYA